MFHLIGIDKITNQGLTTKRPDHLRNLQLRIERAVNWYRNNRYYVDSRHILYRIIESFNIPKLIPDDAVENYIRDRAFKHSVAMGLTSNLNIGRIHPGSFYGFNTKEVYIAIDISHSWDYVRRHYMDLSPVRILRHDQNHISYNLQTPNNYVDRHGFAIIEIDINLLHMQYLAWYREQKAIKMVSLAAGHPDHAIPNVGYFLGMVCLPNALYSHMDQVLINKNIMLTDDEMSSTMDYVGTSFYVNTNSKLIDSVIEDVFGRMRSGDYDIDRVVLNTFGIRGNNAYEIQDTPHVLLNRQNKWAYLLACSRYIRHCLRIPRGTWRNVNKSYINQFQRELIWMKHGNVFNDRAIRELKPYFEEEIQWLYNV